MLEVDLGFKQRHNVTGLVKDGLKNYSQLNPKIKYGENPALKRDEVFRRRLEKIINRSEVVGFDEGSGANTIIFQLLGNDRQKIPILVKVIERELQGDIKQMESSHQLHRKLLGAEFVEDMTRVTITNKKILTNEKVIHKYRNGDKKIESVEAFVQDRRGLDKKQGLFRFLLKNDLSSISPKLKSKLRTFFGKILDAYLNGYGFEFDIFPYNLSEVTKTDISAGILVDDEGVGFIDSTFIYKISESDDWIGDFMELRSIIRIFTNEVSVQGIFRNKGYDDKHPITKNNLVAEIVKLKANLAKEI